MVVVVPNTVDVVDVIDGADDPVVVVGAVVVESTCVVRGEEPDVEFDAASSLHATTNMSASAPNPARHRSRATRAQTPTAHPTLVASRIRSSTKIARVDPCSS